jgi:hypothetical protein
MLVAIPTELSRFHFSMLHYINKTSRIFHVIGQKIILISFILYGKKTNVLYLLNYFKGKHLKLKLNILIRSTVHATIPFYAFLKNTTIQFKLHIR